MKQKASYRAVGKLMEENYFGRIMQYVEWLLQQG